jgi:hypothetical protein
MLLESWLQGDDHLCFEQLTEGIPQEVQETVLVDHEKTETKKFLATEEVYQGFIGESSNLKNFRSLQAEILSTITFHFEATFSPIL